MTLMKKLIAIIMAAIAALCSTHKEAPEETPTIETPVITEVIETPEITEAVETPDVEWDIPAPAAPIDGTDVSLGDL